MCLVRDRRERRTHSRRQASARFRPRPMTDSPLSARSTPLRSNFAGYISTSLHSDGRKLARQSENKSCAPEKTKWPRDFVRPASNSPRCSARARHGNKARGSACRRGRAIVREASPGQDMAITVSTAIFRPLHSAGAPFRRSERWPTSLMVAPTQVGWSDTPPLGYTAVCRDFPFAISSHSLPFRSTSGESELLASRSRDCAICKCTHRLRGGIGMKKQPHATLLTSLRGWACGFAFPDRTQEQLYSKPPHLPYPAAA